MEEKTVSSKLVVKNRNELLASPASLFYSLILSKTIIEHGFSINH
jgi:hypothetical protein